MIFELTPAISNMEIGKYFIQAVWTLFGEARSFVVLDDEISVRDVVKI